MEGFDAIDAALEAWRLGETERADALFRQGIEAYRRTKPDSLHYALGRYGAFLLDGGQLAEAERVLAEATLTLDTGASKAWEDYLRILTHHRDIQGLFATVDRLVGHERPHFPTYDYAETLLLQARRAAREGDRGFAETVARRVMEEATRRGSTSGRWAAAGDLGQILERAGSVDEALALWKATFDEGSDDPITANRLSAYLERRGDTEGAAAVIRQALERGLPANVEEQLRKRLALCEVKQKPGRTLADVPAFSVRHGAEALELAFQIRTKPPIRTVGFVSDTARCYGLIRGTGSIVDIDLATGMETRRHDGLPEFDGLRLASSGWGIGVKRTAAVGKGPTDLWFLNADGHIVHETRVPDATAGLAFGMGLWFVGCRDGYLYAFDQSGALRWRWETPGASNYRDEREPTGYFRPSPYHVAAGPTFIAVASMRHLYAVTPLGTTLWHVDVADHLNVRFTFSVPLAQQPHLDEAFQVLGVVPPATPEEVKRAYLAMVRATHPDVNPGDPDAHAKFLVVQAAREALAASDAWITDLPSAPSASSGIGSNPLAPSRRNKSAEVPGAAGFTMDVRQFVTVGSLTVVAGGITVGSWGHLFVFDGRGQLREARRLGRHSVMAALNPDGSLAAAWCEGMVSFFAGSQVINVAEAPEYPKDLAMVGEDLLLWHGNRVEMMDRRGRLLWAVEFSKPVSQVAVREDAVVVAAGVLVAFRRYPGLLGNGPNLPLPAD